LRPVKLLLDENVGRQTCDILRARGIDVLFVAYEDRLRIRDIRP